MHPPNHAQHEPAVPWTRILTSSQMTADGQGQGAGKSQGSCSDAKPRFENRQATSHPGVVS